MTAPLPHFESAEQVLAFIDDPRSNEFVTWLHERSDMLRPHVGDSQELLWDAQILQLFATSFRAHPYLGPLAEIGGVKIPDPDAFPSDACGYALRRADATRNVVLQARYLDFVYEQRADREAAGRAIDAYRCAVRAHLDYDGDDPNEAYYRADKAVECFGRAFAIALNEGFDHKRDEMMEEGLALTAELVEGQHPTLAPQVAEALLMWQNWQAPNQLTNLQDSLERAVSVCSSFQTCSILGLIELLCIRLRDPAGAKSARRRVAEAEEAEADTRMDSGLVRSAILRRALDAYQRVPDLEACRRVEVKMREAIAQSDSEMKTVETKTTLDFTKWDLLIDGMIEKSGRDAVFQLVANDQNLPSLEVAKNLVLELTERFPMRSLVTNIVVTDDTLNLVATREEYLDAETWKNYGFELSMRFVYLGRAMRMMEQRGSLDEARVHEALSASELFSGRDGIWSHGVERYFAGDYTSFLHIMLPQTEEAVRCFVRRVGRRVTTPGRDGQLELKALGALLASLRDLLDEGVVHFFEFVLCHRQGWNLRNNVMHGISAEPTFCQHLSDAVLWIALRLSLFQVTVEHTVGSQEASAP